MKSPADMKIIQIELTNACTKRCSNCTRFCGHHVEPFFMSFETFKKAVDSMAGFKGIVGIMGGEPTLHPEFEKFVRYFKDHFGYDDDSTVCFGPTSDFVGHILTNVYQWTFSNQRGLWTSVGSKYYDNFELIQDTFGYQLVNDHSAPSQHETLMATRKELGIPDDEWVHLRDNCWIQNLWSASITPKGAFFCEIAAAMDATLGGPGGWPIEPGWWKRTPGQFADQLHWCELCSAALPMPTRNANEETDDVSPIWKKKLEEINSPKLQRGLVEGFDPKAYDSSKHSVNQDVTPYLDDQELRIGTAVKLLRPQHVFHVLQVPSGQSLVEARATMTALKADGHLDLVLSLDAALAPLAADLGLGFLPSEGKTGTELLAQLRTKGKARDWVLLMHGEAPPKDFFVLLATCVFNPGTLHWHESASAQPGGGKGFQFFSVRASSLAGGGDLFDLAPSFPSKKVFEVVSFAPGSYRMAHMFKLYRRGVKRIYWAFKRIRRWAYAPV